MAENDLSENLDFLEEDNPESAAMRKREEDALIASAGAQQKQSENEMLQIANKASQFGSEYLRQLEIEGGNSAVPGGSLSGGIQKITGVGGASSAITKNLITAFNATSEQWGELNNLEFRGIPKRRGLGRVMQLLHLAQRPKMNNRLRGEFNAAKAGMMVKLTDQMRYLSDSIYKSDPSMAAEIKDASERALAAMQEQRREVAKVATQNAFTQEYRMRHGTDPHPEFVEIVGMHFDDQQEIKEWYDKEQADFTKILQGFSTGHWDYLTERQASDMGDMFGRNFGSLPDAGKLFVDQWRSRKSFYDAEQEQKKAGKATKKNLTVVAAGQEFKSASDYVDLRIKSINYATLPAQDVTGTGDVFRLGDLFGTGASKYRPQVYKPTESATRLLDVWKAGHYVRKAKQRYPDGYDNLTAVNMAGVSLLDYKNGDRYVDADGDPDKVLQHAIVEVVHRDLLRRAGSAGVMGGAFSPSDPEAKSLVQRKQAALEAGTSPSRDAVYAVEGGIPAKGGGGYMALPGTMTRAEIANAMFGIPKDVWNADYLTDERVVRQSNELRKELLADLGTFNKTIALSENEPTAFTLD